jgi:nitrogen fixation-related uncharacterized protein
LAGQYQQSLREGRHGSRNRASHDHPLHRGGLAFAAGFVLIAVWAIRDGQFKDVEGVKYRMMKDFNPKGGAKGDGEFKG